MYQQKGFTLLELMVALIIGLFMTGALLQLYMTNKTNYRQLEQRARLQEDLRFAMDFVGSEVRQAAFTGCVSWEGGLDANGNPRVFSNLGIDTLTGAKAALYKNILENQGFVGAESPNSTGSTNSGLVGYGADKSTYYTKTEDPMIRAPIPDQLFFIKVVSGPYPLAANTDNAAPFTVRDVNGGGVPPDITDPSGSSAGVFGMILECSNGGHADIFRVTAVSQTSGSTTATVSHALNSGETPQNITTFGDGSRDYVTSGDPDRDQAMFYEVEFVSYSIYETSEGYPALGRGVDDRRDAVVPYIENMQILYGLKGTEGVASSYVNADEVTNWANVVSLRITFVAQSPQGDSLNKDPATGLAYGYSLPIGVIPDSSAPGSIVHKLDYDSNSNISDNINQAGVVTNPRLRQVLTSTIQLRNKAE